MFKHIYSKYFLHVDRDFQLNVFAEDKKIVHLTVNLGTRAIKSDPGPLDILIAFAAKIIEHELWSATNVLVSHLKAETRPGLRKRIYPYGTF